MTTVIFSAMKQIFWISLITFLLYFCVTFYSVIINYGKYPTQQHYRDLWLLLLCVLEVIFNILTVIFLCAWLFALSKTSVMHWNLKIACFAECMVILSSKILRFPVLLNWYYYGTVIPSNIDQIIRTIRSIIVGLSFANHSCIVLERCFATFFINSYENHKDKFKWSIFLVCVELWCILSHYLVISYMHSYVLAAIFLVIFEIMVGVICVLLLKVNLRWYSNSFGKFLTTRYQTVENIRCLRPVLTFTILALIYNFISINFLAFTHIYFSGSVHISAYADEIWNLISAIFSTLYPLPFIFGNKYFQQKIRKITRKRSALVTDVAHRQFLSITGKPLTVNDESKFYFEELKKAWN